MGPRAEAAPNGWRCSYDRRNDMPHTVGPARTASNRFSLGAKICADHEVRDASPPPKIPLIMKLPTRHAADQEAKFMIGA
jgi:hypothetical protein